MTSRYLGVVALERFLAVERYRESNQMTSSHHPLRSSDPDRAGAARVTVHMDAMASSAGTWVKVPAR